MPIVEQTFDRFTLAGAKFAVPEACQARNEGGITLLAWAIERGVKEFLHGSRAIAG
jgi:hypothetical protein